MGAGVTAGIEVVATIGGALLGGQAQEQAAAAQKRALDIREQQEQIAAKTREVQRIDKLQSVLATQRAIQGARGGSLSSPSFNAIQRSSINNFAQDQNADNLNVDFQRESEEVEKQAAGEQARFGIASEVVGVASNLFETANLFRNDRLGTVTRSPQQTSAAGLPLFFDV